MALKGAGNITFTFDSVAFTPYMNQSELSAVVNAIDTTNFASVGSESIAGLPTFKITGSGPFNSAVEAVIGPALISPPTTQKTAVMVVGGSTYTWTAKAFISNGSFTGSSPSEGLMWSAEFTLSGVPVRS